MKVTLVTKDNVEHEIETDANVFDVGVIMRTDTRLNPPLRVFCYDRHGTSFHEVDFMDIGGTVDF